MAKYTHCPRCGQSLGDPTWCMSCGDVSKFEEGGSLAKVPYQPMNQWSEAPQTKNPHLMAVEYVIARLGLK